MQHTRLIDVSRPLRQSMNTNDTPPTTQQALDATPLPPSTDYAQDHDGPVLQLVRQVLHKGTTLADRVKKLRWKRRRPVEVDGPEVDTEPQEATPESLVEEDTL